MSLDLTLKLKFEYNSNHFIWNEIFQLNRHIWNILTVFILRAKNGLNFISNISPTIMTSYRQFSFFYYDILIFNIQHLTFLRFQVANVHMSNAVLNFLLYLRICYNLNIMYKHLSAFSNCRNLLFICCLRVHYRHWKFIRHQPRNNIFLCNKIVLRNQFF